MHGHESGLYDFAECRELRPMMLVDKLGKHVGAVFKRKRDEEESLAGAGEGKIHCGDLAYSEQVGMGTGACEFEHEHAFFDLVDEEPVGGNVALR